MLDASGLLFLLALAFRQLLDGRQERAGIAPNLRSLLSWLFLTRLL